MQRCSRPAGRIGTGLFPRSLRFLLGALVALACLPAVLAQPAPEFRGMWVNGWNAGFLNASQVTSLINNIRLANCNAVIPQVRRRGDAFYDSAFEPHVTGTTPANFDALADILAKAHNTNAGPYIEVHAWIVTYHIWSGATTPSQVDHPLRLHPDWLLQDVNGNTFIGNQYTFDPGHPEVQKHTFNVCMDIVANYDVDGLNFDYIRYSSADEGYNPVTVARFNQRFGRTGQPTPTDPLWKQFRRDQITGLLRKVYLNAIALKPHIKISCDTITWNPGPANLSAWYSSARAYNDVLQDWRGWMEEGIMDLNIPMAYFDQAGSYRLAWTNWCNFTRDHQYNRHAVIGPGVYLNAIADAVLQMRHTRLPSPAGNYVRGVVGYDYNTPYKGGAGQFAGFRTNLTAASVYDPVSPPIFAQPAAIPSMPWKIAPTKGHLKGTVYGGTLTNPLDGALVNIGGAVPRTQTNDATGFYGFVDLAPGTYTVSASFPGYPSQYNQVTITAGAVATLDIVLSTAGPPSIAAQPQGGTVIRGGNAAFSVGANGTLPLAYQWRLNGAPIAGATTSAYSINNVQASHAGQYSVQITNAAGSAVSDDALLVVIVPPEIDQQPLGKIAVEGEDATFTVSATGSEPLGYQWRFNGGDIPGATSASYTRFNVQPSDAGAYSVVVTNAGGTAVSVDAALQVTSSATPPSITLSPTNQTVSVGTKATFAARANGSAPLRYQWAHNGAPIPGATSPTLVLAVSSNALAGHYSVAVTNAYGAVTSAPAFLRVVPWETPQGLRLLWSLAPGSRPYLTVASLPNERGMAYNPVSHRVLVATRNGPHVYALDAETGADLHELDMTGVSAGTYPLLMIGAAEDGAVFAGNLTTAGATTAFRLYRWENDHSETEPTLVFSGDPAPGSNQRWGDTLDVTGSGASTRVVIGSRSGNHAVVFTTSDGVSFAPSVVAVADAAGGSWGLGLAFGEANTFWGKSNGLPLRQVGFDVGAGTGSTLLSYTAPDIPLAVAPIGVSTRFDLLAGIHIASPVHLRLYELPSASTAPAFVASANFPTDNDNTQAGTGAVDFGEDRVYALCSNNGLMALELVPPPPPVLAAATVLGVTLLEGQGALVRWSGEAGAIYTLQTSTNLTDWTDLQDVGSVTAIYELLDPSALNGGACFYRVRTATP